MRHEKKEVYRYRIQVNGLFGRNRTVKSESFTLCDTDRASPKTLDDLKPLYRAKLAEIRLKGGVVVLYEDPITTEERNGFVRESFVLFSGKELQREKIEGGGIVFR